MITLSEIQLKNFIKESVREAIIDEFANLKAFLSPCISSREQKEIEKLYNKPSRKIAKTYHIEI